MNKNFKNLTIGAIDAIKVYIIVGKKLGYHAK
jgi:hypothetical protein